MFKELINKGSYDYVNSDITEENFSDKRCQTDYKIFKFKKPISSEKAIKAMGKKGYRPANALEILNYGATEWNRKDCVVALGEIWTHPYGLRNFVYLYWNDSGRRLDLGWCDGDWDDYWRFLAVGKSSDTKTLSDTLNFCPCCGYKLK